MRFTFWILFLSACIGFSANAANCVFLPNKEIPIKILESKKETYLLTEKSLFIKQNKAWSKIKNRDSLVEYKSALFLRDTLWLGSSKGLFAYKREMKEIAAVAIGSLHKNGSITGLAVDAEQHLWVSVFNQGAYRKFGSKFELLLDVNSTSALTATPKGDVWVGSDIGLFQYNLKDNTWARYAEEGVSGSGLEIPDNIIDNLFSDNFSNTWVLMPDYFTLISGEKGKEHLSFGGRALNHIETIYSIFALDAKTFVFFSANGLLAYLPPLTERSQSNEVHAAENQKLIQLNVKDLIGKIQQGEVFFFIADRGKKDCWLVSNRAVYFVKKSKLRTVVLKQI